MCGVAPAPQPPPAGGHESRQPWALPPSPLHARAHTRPKRALPPLASAPSSPRPRPTRRSSAPPRSHSPSAGSADPRAPDAVAPSSRVQLRRRGPLTATLHPPAPLPHPAPGSGPTARELAAPSPALSEEPSCGDERRLRGHGRARVALGRARGDQSPSGSLGREPSREAAAAAAAGAAQPG